VLKYSERKDRRVVQTVSREHRVGCYWVGQRARHVQRVGGQGHELSDYTKLVCTEFTSSNMTDRGHWEDLRVDARVILYQSYRNREWRAWTDLIRLVIGTRAGRLSLHGTLQTPAAFLHRMSKC
jgi:hypothetical protein